MTPDVGPMILRCGNGQCRQPIERIDGVLQAQGAHAFYAVPCGHVQSPSTAKDAYEAGTPPVFMQDVTGLGLIASERRRQNAEEGASAEHDAGHTASELAWAAWVYLDRATAEHDDQAFSPAVPSMWPWKPWAWKPGPTRIRMLVKAGALVAAEIDRRLKDGQQP